MWIYSIRLLITHRVELLFHRCSWICKEFHRCLFSFIDVCGVEWIVDSTGFGWLLVWIPLDDYGLVWIDVDIWIIYIYMDGLTSAFFLCNAFFVISVVSSLVLTPTWHRSRWYRKHHQRQRQRQSLHRCIFFMLIQYVGQYTHLKESRDLTVFFIPTRLALKDSMS